MAKGADRNPKVPGSTHCLKGATQLGGEVIANGMDATHGDFNVKSMKNGSQNKFFRGAGGMPSMKSASSSLGGSVKS